MKKMMIVLVGMTAMLAVVPETMAGHHKDKGNDGLRLAAGIVNLVKYALTPTPQVVYQPAPPPPVDHRPAVIVKDHHKHVQPPRRPAPPRHAPAKPAPKKHNNHKGRR